MAIDDFGGTVLGKKIELISADVLNKPDVAVAIASRWYDAEHVDAILGAGASSSSIAAIGVAGERKRIFFATDPASSDITGKLCNPYTCHCRQSHPAILMMEPAQDRHAENLADRLNRARQWRILAQ